MLRKRVKDLETEYKQLQLEYQVKESRVVDLESDVEVSVFTLFGNELVSLNVLWVSSGAVLGCPQFGHVVVLPLFLIFMSLILCVCKIC